MHHRAHRAILGTILALAACEPDVDRTAERARAAEEDAPAGLSSGERRALEEVRGLPYLAGIPADATSEPEGVIVHDRARSQPGYNLYSAYALSRADLIDVEGEIVRTWSHTPSERWSNSELLPNGDLLVVGFGANQAGRSKRYLMRMSWEGQVIWQRFVPAHHDVEVTHSGRLLVLTTERRPIPQIDQEIETRDDHLTFLDQDGRELESVSLFEIFSSRPDRFEFQAVAPSVSGAIRRIDLFHANSIESIVHPRLVGTHPIFQSGYVLVSVRHQDVVAIVDPAERTLVWVWGRGELSGPHDAQMLASGNIIVFDNGIHPDRQWSRVVEIDPRTNQIVWQYRAPEPTDFYTNGRGSSQRLANGNTLIASSEQAWAFEVTPDGDIVWEFRCPLRLPNGERATIVRMKRYEVPYIDRIRSARARVETSKLETRRAAGSAAEIEQATPAESEP